MRQQVLTLCHELDAELKTIRQYLHAHPELSRQEYQTAVWLKNLIQPLGLTIEQTGNTPGFIAILDSEKAGKTVALRTDIDALPIYENEHNLNQPRQVISQNPGVMHACGHDAHMAMMIGTIRVLVHLKSQLTGKVIFCFESAEEDSGGWQDILHLLARHQPNAIYGTHVTAFMQSGTFSADPGPVMAGCIELAFEVIGRGGHGSRPDLSVNPVFPMAAIINNFAHAYANYKAVDKVVTLGITQLEASKARNVIADSGLIGGSLRFFDSDEARRFWAHLKHIAETTAAMHQCQIRYLTDSTINSVINDHGLATLLQNSIQQLYPQQLQHNIKWYASESFAQYATLAPCCFMFLGIASEQAGSGADHHNTHFDVDENTLKQGTAALSYCALRYLTERPVA